MLANQRRYRFQFIQPLTVTGLRDNDNWNALQLHHSLVPPVSCLLPVFPRLIDQHIQPAIIGAPVGDVWGHLHHHMRTTRPSLPSLPSPAEVFAAPPTP